MYRRGFLKRSLATFSGVVLSSTTGLFLPDVLKLLTDEKVALSVKLNLYQRHTASPDWHSRFKNLYAYVISLGYRYRF